MLVFNFIMFLLLIVMFTYMNYIDLISITFYISIIISSYYLSSHSIIYLFIYSIIIIYFIIFISIYPLLYSMNLTSHSISIIMLITSIYLSLYLLSIYFTTLTSHSISISFVISIVIMRSFVSYHSNLIDSSSNHAIITCITYESCSSIMLLIIPYSYILLILITQIDSIFSISINYESSTHNALSSISIYIVIAMSNPSDLITSSITMNV